ncbi:MAG: hypothetical protein LBQ80_03430 [Clostridium sp.]|jgi:hypothetical protein|nr:hypothetical protein [Clostridium sp.]
MGDLYDAIFVRRSVRQYEPEPLSAQELEQIKAVLDEAPQLPGQSARFVFADAGELKGVAAPHAVLAYSSGDDAAMCNIGYTLQTLDLWLQGNGYGSLWMGMGKPLDKSADYRVLLAFGRSSVPLRKSVGEFKRKAVLEISNEDNAVANTARLAPSAMNFQPWKMHFDDGKLLCRLSPNGIFKLLPLKLQSIDLGIFLKTTVLALEHEGKSIDEITLRDGKSFAVGIKYS